VLSVGTFRNAPYYDIAALVEVYRSQHPDARVQMRGQNSFDVARAVYGQEVEIGLVVLPIDDALLEVHPLFRDEVVLVSPVDAARDEAVRIEELAELPLVLYDATYGFDDPTRRQLAARAQEAGILLEPIVEVEHVETALQLVARGMGSTVAASSVVRASADPQAVSSVGFSEPFYDSFAVVTRRGVRLSPAAQALMDLISPWAAGVSSRLV
jgi:DNA-binding transcriptional LysR family regulator